MNDNLELFEPKNDFKTKSPLRFPGSKFQALKYILPFIVEHDEYREPFFGSGAVFFYKRKVKINWINDIDKDLITTFKGIADSKIRIELIENVKNIKPSKEYFNFLRDNKPKNNFERIFRYFVLNRTAYSGIMNKPNFGFHPIKSVQPNQWPNRLEQAGKKLKKIKITNLDFEEVILAPPKGEQVFMFIDPPYIKADQKRAYYHSFKEKDHQRLEELLKRTKYKFCLTLDNCEEAKQLYSWANIQEREWRYHTANSNQATRKLGKELIITNY